MKAASSGAWGRPFAAATRGQYFCAKTGAIDNPRALFQFNWVQLNNCTYGDPKFCSKGQDGKDYDWKIQARFGTDPLSGLWRKKAPFIPGKWEYSLDGEDVWGISCEDMYDYLAKIGEGTLLPKLMFDLRATWPYVCSRYP